jgi:recombination protein RecA
MVAWIDLGRSLEPDYLHRCGIDLDRLLVVHPADGADGLAIALHLVESRTLAALVFDSTLELIDADPGTVSGSIPHRAYLCEARRGT